LVSRVEDFIRYIKEVDAPGVEVVVAYIENEPWHEAFAKNALARAATTNRIILTALDDHPSASIIERTRIELDANPWSVVTAMRLDGLPTHRAFPNPFALGDWIAMRKDRYLALGGYNESLRAACWLENEFIGRAILNGYDCVMLDERIFHGWHPVRTEDAKLDVDSDWNYKTVLAAGGALALLYYPTTGTLRFADKDVSISVRPQKNSVVNVTHHLPYSYDYWECIHKDKTTKLQQWVSENDTV
jgi:hypothetical protein